MYSIGEVSRRTGIAASALRYYEKIGVLPRPRRQDGTQHGNRWYDDEDLRFIQFIDGLKKTGMKLEDIAAFTESGCLVGQSRLGSDVDSILHRRIEILDQHMENLQGQIEHLEVLRTLAHEKRDLYAVMLNRSDHEST